MRDLSFESSVWSEKAAQLGRWEVQEEGLFVKLGCITKLMGNFKQVWVLKRTLSLCVQFERVRSEERTSMDWLLQEMMGARNVLQSSLDQGLSPKTQFFPLHLPPHPLICVSGSLGCSYFSAFPQVASVPQTLL